VITFFSDVMIVDLQVYGNAVTWSLMTMADRSKHTVLLSVLLMGVVIFTVVVTRQRAFSTTTTTTTTTLMQQQRDHVSRQLNLLQVNR